MDIKNVLKSQGTFPCPGDLSENGDELLHLNGVVGVTAGRAEQCCSKQMPSHPTDVTTCHTGSCCLNTQDSGSPQSLADVQQCKKTGLGRPLTTHSLLGEQADTSVGNPTDFVEDDSENSAAVLEIYAEQVPSGSDDFSDDDLEYFECSDVLTAREEEVWKSRLRFLLESDDEGDCRLGEDCDGCAYFLGEMPYAWRVSDNATPMDTPIGLCEHQSKTNGVHVRRDPSVCSQSALQTEMTLTVGQHRDESATWEDKDKNQVPAAAAAVGNEHPRSEEETGGSDHLAAGASMDEPKPRDTVPAQPDSPASGVAAACSRDLGTMTEASTAGDALGESSALLEEGRSIVPEGNAQHAACTLTATLRRNLFKLLNPIELCRYVSTIGQSFQAAAGSRESRAPSPGQESVLSAQIPEETEKLQRQAGLCVAEEADEDHWEGKRAQGLAEQNQVPDETISLGHQDANLQSVTQNCEKLCMEARTEKEGILRACGSAGANQLTAEPLSAENTPQVQNAASQTSCQRCALCEEKEARHQQVFSGQEVLSHGEKPQGDVSPFPPWDVDSAPDKQECLCAVLSSARLCDEPGQGERRSGLDLHASSNPDILCSLSAGEAVSEASPESVLESGEPGRPGDADGSAARDKLWKLLRADDSDDQVPFETRGTTGLEVRLTDKGADGCLDLSAVNERETPAICVAENNVLSSTQQCLEPNPMSTDRNGFSAAWEGKLAVSSASQSCGADAPRSSPKAQSGNLGCPKANPACTLDTLCGRTGQFLHTACSISLINESGPGEGCHFKDCYPVREELVYFPEEKDIFPSENTSQFTHSEHSSENTTHKSYEANLQDKGNHSDFSAPKDTDSGSYHLSNNNDCQDFQVVSNAQKNSYIMQSPTLIEIHETTSKNLPQNTDQVTEIAKQEGAVPPPSGDPFFRGFYLEVPSCEPGKPGGEQREICRADEPRDAIFCDPAASQVSASQTAASPPNTAEQPLFLVDSTLKSQEELKASKASQGLFQRAPGGAEGEAALCENEHEIPRATGCNPDEAETKAPLPTLTACQAGKHMMNISTEQSCPDFIPSSKITEAENSVKSTEDGKEEEVRAAETVVSGLVNLPPADSGNKQSFQEQPACRKTQSFSLAWTTPEPFPVNTDTRTNQEGSNSCQPQLAAAEPVKWKEDTAKPGHFAAGAKKKLPPATLSKKPRLEERGSVGKDSSCVNKSGKSEGGVVHKEDRKEPRKLILKKDSKAPRLLKKIQAELFPDRSENIQLCCQFGDVHGDSTITWTKDSKVLAQLQRSARDDSPVCLTIAKANYNDQGMYYCCLSNVYGKVTAEFHLTAAVLERLSSFQSYEGVEEIEFMPLLFREDPLSSSYFGGTLRGAIATEGLHFGEGMHRRAFRSRVLQGLAPAFGPGRPCVLKVHSALTYGTKSREELLQKNYSLALQECYVQNTAREYARLYAAEAEPLEGFGEVPEIIPIFLIHRPANNIPYATVEEELVGEFVKYSVKDGKEVNFLRRDSEAGQKCCTFQHWVYEKTNGNLLVTDLQGVGMKLTDVGIATLAKGYKGFKGNCSFSFIEQFRALHQCNEYCEMLGLKSLRAAHQKQRKATPMKSKNLPNSSTAKKTVPKKAREPRDLVSSEH